MEPTKSIVAPFTVVIDTRERAPWLFQGLTANQKDGGLPLVVPTAYRKLQTGDYSLDGYGSDRGSQQPGITIERKSKADFLGSLVKRSNFISRLERMKAYEYSAVIVEAEWSEIASGLSAGQDYGMPFKSVIRTVLAWDQRYPTRWHFMPGRRAAEKVCFRLLERFWLDRNESITRKSRRVPKEA